MSLEAMMDGIDPRGNRKANPSMSIRSQRGAAASVDRAKCFTGEGRLTSYSPGLTHRETQQGGRRTQASPAISGAHLITATYRT